MGTARSPMLDPQRWVRYDPTLIRAAVPVRPRAVRPYLDMFTIGESFGHRLMELAHSKCLRRHHSLLDPFAGSGSSLWSARSWGMEALGFEQLPYAHFCFRTASQAITMDVEELALIGRWLDRDEVAERDLDISAVPPHMREQIGPGNASCAISYRDALRGVTSGPERELLLFVLMKTLRGLRRQAEQLRFPRKGVLAVKDLKGNFHSRFESVFQEVLFECLDVLTEVRQDGSGLTLAGANLLFGSTQDLLPDLKPEGYDLVITSPPYFNGFDYLQEYETEHWCLGLTARELAEVAEALVPTKVDPKDGGFMPGPAIRRALGKGTRIPGSAGLYLDHLNRLIGDLQGKLERGAEVFLVIDDIMDAGHEVAVAETISILAESAGFRVEAIYADSPRRPTEGLGWERHLTKVCHWEKV
jgi:hypothetical protein